MSKKLKAVKKTKKVKKESFVETPDLDCVKGFREKFLEPANSVLQQMNENSRFTIVAGYHRVKDDEKQQSYYMAQILYGKELIMVERYPMLIHDDSDHSHHLDTVIYRILLTCTTSGLFNAMKAVMDQKKS